MAQGLDAPGRNSKLEIRNSPRFSIFDFQVSGFQSRTFLPWAASALSGLLLVACFPKIHLRGLVWVACLPLLMALPGEKRLKHAFMLGYVCGAVFFAGSCYWFLTVMELYGHLAPALAVGVLILFVIIDSTFFGGFALLMGWAARRSSGWALALSPFLWVAMELARTYLITGFPWDLLGYAMQASGVRQIASVTGVYGLSFLAVATSALLAWVLLSTRRPRAGLALAGWLVLLLLAQWRMAPPPQAMGKELAFLLQPNVPLDEAAADAWAPWRDPSQLQQLVQLSVTTVEQVLSTARQAPSQGVGGHPPLLIWAENPAPFFFTRDPVFRNAMENMARQTHAIVIANTIIPVDAKGETITNSAVTLDPEGREVSRYDKIHLVPFGEYVPAWALPGLVNKITSEVGNFVPGSSYSVAKSPGGGIGVFICYEAIIPQLARKLVAGGAGVLVNISNDAWYGDSAAAYQHLEMARLRAIENHRYLLRATNNGLTTLIDPYGRVLEEIPRYQRRFMLAHFNFETRQTFYSAHGDAFAWLCAAIAALMLGATLRRVKDKG
ncbi:MAG: apolipoprotein N-acyltransferase [Terriglobia bacterium]|jgi:apolipoprotein N-acyltransferase